MIPYIRLVIFDVRFTMLFRIYNGYISFRHESFCLEKQPQKKEYRVIYCEYNDKMEA